MKKIIPGFQVVVLMAFIFYVQFHNLGKLPFRIWDEARLATNAYEIARDGNWLVPTVDEKPDMWNTKPPLMVWAQALLIKLHGLTELSVRLPSAICAALTTLLVVMFVLYITASPWAALLSGIVLSTASGYIGIHGTRFGEYDSMLALFTTCYLFAFFMYTESAGPRRNKYLLLFFISLTCAVLTKGIAGLLYAPSVVIYVLFRKQLISTLGNKYFYVGALGFFVFVLGYYFLREHYNPGYLAAVSQNEFGGRFIEANGGHGGNWDYYWNLIKKDHFRTWYWALPSSLFFVWFLANAKIKRALIFCVLCSLSFIVVISASKTKILWYDIPVYPLFACIVGILVLQFATILSQFKYVNKQFALIALIIAFSIQPVLETFNFIKWQYDDLSKDNSYAVSYYLRDAAKGKRELKNATYLFSGYTLQYRLYVKELNDLGKNIKDISLWGSARLKVKVGDKIITNEDDPKRFIEAHYEYKILDEFYGVKYYELTGIK